MRYQYITMKRGKSALPCRICSFCLKKALALALLALTLSLTSIMTHAAHSTATAQEVTEQAPQQPLRIVSLAPHLTEWAFSLGLGDNLVGVSDYSDYPEKLVEIVAPILQKDIDFTLGARSKNLREAGSMTLPQIFGNWLATTLMKVFFRSRFTDLGPFRAIKYNKLLALQMEDKTYGWTVEMQLKVLKRKYTYQEIPVPYRNRIGVSKVSGTVKGAIFAGFKILGWIFKYAFKK